MTYQPIPLFEYQDVVARIDAMIEEEELLKKDVAAAIGLSPSQFSDKRQERSNRFSLDELARIALFFQEHLKRPLPLWPLISRAQSEGMAAIGFRPEPPPVSRYRRG